MILILPITGRSDISDISQRFHLWFSYLSSVKLSLAAVIKDSKLSEIINGKHVPKHNNVAIEPSLLFLFHYQTL